MFEIGNSLREARLRQGIELPRVEAETKIRMKYLRGLEEERFEVLPAETYVKGFLRTYAEYLGLDGQLYVDEFNSRFAREEETVLGPSSTEKTRHRRVESNFIVVTLAGIVAVTILVVVAWTLGSGDENPSSDLLLGTTPATTQASTTVAGTTAQTRTPSSQARLARVVLTAARGDCWIQVRAGGVNGQLLYEGTVQRGQTQRFAKWRRLWINLGAPGNLDARLNGRRVNFPSGQSIVLVSAKGVRTLSTL